MFAKCLKSYPLTVILLVVITFLSLYPFTDVPEVNVPFADKWTHMVMYGGFSMAVLVDMCRQKAVRRIFLYIFLLPTLYGGLMELAQAYLTTTRSGDWYDFLADGVGSLLIAVVVRSGLRCVKVLLLMLLIPTGASAQEKGYPALYAGAPRFRALIYYSEGVEPAHREFAQQALAFFHKLSYGEGFLYDKTTDLSQFTDEQLAQYDIQIWLNNSVHSAEQRAAFQRYMEQGGGWMGFHAAAYNDKNTGWPWYNEFLGCGKFYCNNWPPQCVLVDADTQEHPVTRSLPQSWVMPSSEWYQWDPSPRQNPDVEVLVSISQKNYPLGIKDVVRWGDFPIVWTNRKFRMVYLNIGHGDECFSDAATNLLYTNAFRWVVSTSPKGDPFGK